MRASLGLARGAKVAGVIARLTEQKGHRFLLQAMTTPALADLQLLVVGDGDLRDALKAEAQDLGIAARVHFLGARRDLGDLLAAIDVFVMPSLWEGLPLSMILAMGAAVPVVVTEVAGIPEVVADGKTGWLVPAGNSLALATALVDVFRDRVRTATIAQAARDFVLPRFGVDGYINSVVGLYDELVRLKPGTTRTTAA
jgi:glycosyltransferase involved in cell wall biosynthesis